MTFDDLHRDLLRVVAEVGARPDVPLESETFFSEIIENFAGSQEECLAYIQVHLQEWFRCVSVSPVWIQEAEWQFSEGKPMVFVGQTNVPVGLGWFHDDASFFHFWNPETEEMKTILQVY